MFIQVCVDNVCLLETKRLLYKNLLLLFKQLYLLYCKKDNSRLELYKRLNQQHPVKHLDLHLFLHLPLVFDTRFHVELMSMPLYLDRLHFYKVQKT